VTKGAKEFGGRRRGNHRGSRRYEPGYLKEVHKVARSDKEMAIAAAGIAQALDVLEMMTKRLEGLCIEFLKRQSGLLRPEREALHPTHQMRDAAALVSAFFEPTNKRIEVRASRSRTILLQCQGGSDISRQHAALLHEGP
jgi:hypothetical protein